MGMFDWVRCEYPLPDPEAQGYQFQTKDTPCLMEHYIITAEGRLIAHEWDYEATPDDELPYKDSDNSLLRLFGCIRRVAGSERLIDIEWDGPFNFYGDVQTGGLHAIRISTGEDLFYPGPQPPWYEYLATFAGGQLQEIRRLEVAPYTPPTAHPLGPVPTGNEE
jgi:hypothetical protein